MNEKSKLKRQKRVRKQRVLQKAKTQKDSKEKAIRERLEYQTRQRPTPAVNSDDSTLERNIKVLEAAMAEHEALQSFREENKEKAEDQFAEAKAQQKEYTKQFSAKAGTNWTVANPDVASIFETTTAGFGPVGGFHGRD